MERSIALLTLAHVLISMVAMGAGFVVLGGVLNGRTGSPSTRLFLSTTALSVLTGFLFPIKGITPALVVGVVSAALLLPVCYAIMVRKLRGRWRGVYVIGAVTLIYLNVFVLVAQFFLKIPAIRELAPTLREAPFLIVQLCVLVLFTLLALQARTRFRPAGV